MDLSAHYLGLNLRNPLVASASPRASSVDGVRQLARGGVAAVVLPSMFEEELHREAAQNAELLQAGTDSFAESLSYFPDIASPEPNPHRYLSLVERAAAAVDVPVIASLNAITAGGWTRYASVLEKAGAAAIELNIYHLPDDALTPGREIEQRHIDVLASVKAAVSIPVAVKLSPYYSSIGEMAHRFDQAGADGLVLFNRFLHPGIDPETLTTTAGFGLSSPAEGRLPRTWIAHLAAGCGVSRGQHRRGRRRRRGGVPAGRRGRGDDHVVVAAARARSRHGAGAELTAWMNRKGFTSLSDFRGLLAVSAGPAAAARERAGYVRSLRAADRGEGPWY